MNLAIFHSFKEGMRILEQAGQADRFIDYYLEPYSRSFDKVYVYGWQDEEFEVPFKNVILVPNRRRINIYLYNFLLPFIERETLRECQVSRLMQFTAVIPAVICKLFYGMKIVATYGFPYANTLKVKGNYFKLFLWRIVERLLLRQVSLFIVTYQNNKDFLISAGVAEGKIHLSPNGVDTGTFAPDPSKQSGSQVRLFFVGRFEVEKNLINLAKALAGSEYKDKIFLALVGKGSLREQLEEELKAANIDYQIIPKMRHNELPSAFRRSDIFLLPSITEGYPKVLIEAMSCGLPAVVGRYKGHESIVKHMDNAVACGFEPGQIREAIDLLIGDQELRRKIGRGARFFVEMNNDIKKIIEKEIEVIKSVK